MQTVCCHSSGAIKQISSRIQTHERKESAMGRTIQNLYPLTCLPAVANAKSKPIGIDAIEHQIEASVSREALLSCSSDGIIDGFGSVPLKAQQVSCGSIKEKQIFLGVGVHPSLN